MTLPAMPPTKPPTGPINIPPAIAPEPAHNDCLKLELAASLIELELDRNSINVVYLESKFASPTGSGMGSPAG